MLLRSPDAPRQPSEQHAGSSLRDQRRRCAEFLLKNPRSGDTLIPQGLLAGVLLWLGWQAQRIGWNVWGLGIAASCYCLFYLGVVSAPGAASPWPGARSAVLRRGLVVLLVLGQFGSVGLAGNSLPGPRRAATGQPSQSSTPAAAWDQRIAAAQSFVEKLPRSGDTLIPQGLLAGVLLWLGWQAQRIGWNVWGLGIAASCYCLFYLGVVLHRVQHPHGPARGAPAAPGPLWCCWCWGSSAV